MTEIEKQELASMCEQIMIHQMTDQEHAQYLEDLAWNAFGRSPILARAGNQCVKCGKGANTFRDDTSKREYEISLFCQNCQDDAAIIEEINAEHDKLKKERL